MKKHSFKDLLRYKFDNLMSKGTVALVGMLFLATTLVVVIAGIVLALIDRNQISVRENIWSSIMHIIDAGTITAADTANPGFIIIMSLVTLCGLFVTSILIGIITTGFEEKLNTLKKGNSKVLESNHTVILGFDNNIFSLISETIIANENHKNACIVVLANEDKEEVETAIADMIPDFKTTRIICRTGNITDTNMLARCSIETARSIIINEEKDFITIKSILAVNSYLDKFKGSHKIPHVVATVTEPSNYEAAKIISDGNAEIILVEDAVSRIIAQTCRQPGLSNVLIELFDYDGCELYFEKFPNLKSDKFGNILNYFEEAVLFGYKRDGKVYLNPTEDTVIHSTDELLLLVEDDGMAKLDVKQIAPFEQYEAKHNIEPKPENLLIIGTNAMLNQTVLELDQYFAKGSKITIANFNEIEEITDCLQNLSIKYEVCDVNNRANLLELTSNNISHVILFSDDESDSETSDAVTLLRLIHLRDISRKEGLSFSITSEMKDVANQKLAKVAEANDLVVGSNIINLILTQIAENRSLAYVFQELLRAEGSEITIREASHYVKLNTEIDFYTVTNILKGRNEVAVGYKKQNGRNYEIVTNPKKSEKITFTENDYIISLAVE